MALHAAPALAAQVRRCLRQDRLARMLTLQETAAEASRKGDSRTLYRIVKELTHRPAISPIAITMSDGTPASSAQQVAARWVEHFADTYH
eukprot:9969225-Alexandrium_andersonii.AAC.1